MLAYLAVATLVAGQSCFGGSCEVRSFSNNHVSHSSYCSSVIVPHHPPHKVKFCGEWPDQGDKYAVTYCYYGKRDYPTHGTWTVFESVFNVPQQRHVWVKIADFTSPEKAKEYIGSPSVPLPAPPVIQPA